MAAPRGKILAAIAGGSAALAGAALTTRFILRRLASGPERVSGAGGLAVEGHNRGQRTRKIAKTGAVAGKNLAATKAKGIFASDERKAELQAEFELKTAEQVTEMLGGMKGALMKIGQMASYLDQGLPDSVRGALSELQAEAPPMAWELAREVIETEFDKKVEDVFVEFDTVPVAAASIGQVHRAITNDGREVAVKVQYPGVKEAVAADLENTDLIFNLLKMLFPTLDPAPIVQELKERLVEELDYLNEARNQQLFADAYRDHPYFRIPAVQWDLTTQRVLTTEFIHGSSFSEVMKWSNEERQLTAETLYRFAFGGIYRLHAFNGDPHPGNYIFHPGGVVTFLDFGLCKHFTHEEIDIFESMIVAFVIEQDLKKFRRIIEDVGILAKDVDLDPDDLREYFGHFYEFVLEDTEREITPEYSSDSIRRFFDLSGPHVDIMKSANLPASMVIVQRINLGLFALFADLKAKNNWRQISEEIWTFTEGKPSTPMGEKIAAWEAEYGPTTDA